LSCNSHFKTSKFYEKDGKWSNNCQNFWTCLSLEILFCFVWKCGKCPHLFATILANAKIWLDIADLDYTDSLDLNSKPSGNSILIWSFGTEHIYFIGMAPASAYSLLFCILFSTLLLKLFRLFRLCQKIDSEKNVK